MARTLSDPGDTGAGSDYVKNSAYKVPEVAVQADFVTPPSLTGDVTESDGDGNQSDVPTASPFTVRPSDIRDLLESKILTELNTQVNEFDGFKKLIQDTEGWIFLVQDPTDMAATFHGSGYTSLSAGYNPNPWYSDFSDPHPDDTQAIVDSQNALLRAVADSYELVGQLVGVLNDAAQNYVHTDQAVFDQGTNYDDYPLHLPPGVVIR
jgi:hypothetical protein